MNHRGTVEVDGFELGYRIEGSGLPALVIGSTVYYPRTFLGDIRQHLQLIFIDIRAFVPSPERNVTTEKYELAVLLADVETIRKALNLERFVVIGHSGLAFLALEYAKAYPEHVSHVVMIGNSPDFSEVTTQARINYFDQYASADRKAAFYQNMARLPEKLAAEPDRRFAHMCVAVGPIGWYDETFDASPLWEGVYTNMPVIDHVWGVVFRDIDITKGLSKLEQPVWLALGRYDYQTGTPFLWEPVPDGFNNLTISVFDKSAHTPQLEESERFNETLRDWLERSC